MFRFSKKMGLGMLLAVSLNVQGLVAQAAPIKPVTNAPVGNTKTLLPTGHSITPLAAPGSTFVPLSTGLRQDGTADAAEAVKTTLSPDGKTLLVLTSGYNTYFFDQITGALFTYPVLDPTNGQPTTITTPNAEWVFVYDVSGSTPIKVQQLNIPNTYNGLSWASDGSRFYVSAGIDDRVYVYKNSGSTSAPFVPDAPFILLGHNSNQTAPLPSYDGGLLKNTIAGQALPLSTGAVVSGVALSIDGKTLAAANFENDSLSIVDTGTRLVTKEVKFFQPGQTIATGEFPFDVLIQSDSNGAAVKAYVSSQRDNEVLTVDIASGAVTRIPVGGQPNKMIFTANQHALYVANGNSDTISVIDTSTNTVSKTYSLARPNYKYKGSTPTSLALSTDEKTLYVTLANENAVAVVDVASGSVLGRIPTGWYPNSVTVSADGTKLYVVNAKSNSGPAPGNCCYNTPAGLATNTTFINEYVWNLEKAGLSVIPIPNKQTLAVLSKQVDVNNAFRNQVTNPVIAQLQNKIKHIIYVVKENRTYDQMLGDLGRGNSDPSLAFFGQAITPNHHQLALTFTTLDNFYDPAESSGVGWTWTTSGRTTDYTEKTQSVLYGNANFSGLTYDYEGTTRNINLGLRETISSPIPNFFRVRLTGLVDPSGSSSILPGSKDVNAPEGDGELSPSSVGGYIWDAALRAGKTVRNYGFLIDGAFYITFTSGQDPTQPDPNNPLYLPISPTPYASQMPQAVPTKLVLRDKTDIYFRSFDQNNADAYLFDEWQREFNQYVTRSNLPNLSLVRFSHDHTGSFGSAAYGVNTPELQVADNDYALGKLVEAVSHSPYWQDTVIVVVEDDAQDGPDHVDSHRSLGYMISAYTKRGAVISTTYNTVNLLRTIEDLLGLDHISMFTANAKPMADVFTTKADFTPYTAIVPGGLCATSLNLPGCTSASTPKSATFKSLHNAEWWAAQTRSLNFSREDLINPAVYNRILWKGIRGENTAYPEIHPDLDR